MVSRGLGEKACVRCNVPYAQAMSATTYSAGTTDLSESLYDAMPWEHADVRDAQRQRLLAEVTALKADGVVVDATLAEAIESKSASWPE